MKFTTMVVLDGNNTGIEVPSEVLDALGGGKRPAVVLTAGALTYRSTVGSMGGRALIPLSAARRVEAGLVGGETIEVEIALDTAPREVQVPEDLARELAMDEGALAFFQSLSYSNQNRHVLSVTDAKSEETRARRIAKVVDAMKARQK
ncbi:MULTISPECIES: YdeI/OmpD-associated family protein [Devosia]|uniref:DUF1905 domain-containing protein n=1 Tax=Devosia equisanguinis TaxID=2490941 RepID=A0A3S4ENP5_9HYPH|nr:MULTISPECIES: YdeI/OmpD-associated family protein [Devosia]ODT49770.1 MAG: hypothetical protein ABS74_06065 [Pelagibacterium sp. SCN 63-126]ODU80540.1 MAG: hypothetical protein ABT14_18800 [Pelagibacterium sp. SCN 63-17]OJX45143.1 MAG: hypothetical protein BGO80_04715 [Devosia sp. 63-57]VDS06274.1 hypothetical protein DEVEQU_03430 [Devosia equisanguinis]